MIAGRKNLSKLRSFMEVKNLDAVLFFNYGQLQDVNLTYFTGFSQAAGTSALLITKEKRVLFVTPFDLERARSCDADEIVNIRAYDGSYSKAIAHFTKHFKAIGVNKSKISLTFVEKLAKLKKVKLFDVGDFLLELRSIKFMEEIELIKKAGKICDKVARVIEEVIGKTSEKEIARLVEEEIRWKRNCELAFLTIVASGQRTKFPHPFPTFSRKRIKRGVGFVDFGVKLNGYCTDVTLPYIKGELSKKEKRLVESVLEAYDVAVASVEVEKPTWEVFDEVNDFLKRKGYELAHGLGHGIGLEIHEKPSIEKKERQVDWKEERFKRNMVFTLEPAIYSKRFGCRIENDFLLKKRPLALTHVNLIEVNV